MKNYNFVWACYLLMSALILPACDQSPSTSQPINAQNQNTGFPIPQAITALPDVSKLSATIDCPNGTTAPMTISPDKKSASGSCYNLTPGTNEAFTIHFSYIVGNTPIELAQATQNMDVVAGKNPALSITTSYNENFDDDQDGFNNLYEVANNMNPELTNYNLGGNVSGLTGTLVLSNGTDQLTLNADSTFKFPVGLISGDSYDVKIVTQPSGQTCTLTNGSGTVDNTAVTTIAVTCDVSPPPSYLINVDVSGVSGSLVLANGSDELTITTNGTSTFSNSVVDGGSYAVTVKTAPSGLSCVVNNGSGNVNGGDVSNITVACTPIPYAIQVTASGVNGTLKLANGSDVLTITTDGTYQFSKSVINGGSYDVTVNTPPSGESCTVTNGSGKVNASDVTNITVSCTPNAPSTYTVSVTVSGLSGTLILNNNNNDDLTITSDGTYTFATAIVDGSTYNVTVKTQPNTQLCNVAQGSGQISGANVTNVTATCATNTTQWTWMGGSNLVDASGVYGIQGTPDPNNFPGARDGANQWIDSSGDLWLFGGYGYDKTTSPNNTNDLWRYNTSTSQWEWVSGSDTANALGNYGSLGVTASTNMISARQFAVQWIDTSGKFWVFGGYSYLSSTAYGDLNDLWVYDPATNQWTWMNGSNTFDSPGTYGTKGTAASGNTPGARYNAITWVGTDGSLWLFGGIGYTTAGSIEGELNDLWRYDVTTNQWTWISGTNTENATGVYGTLGTPSVNNIPGGRDVGSTWVDTSGNFWLFGGNAYDSGGSLDYINDLWRYNPSTNEWTWVKGSSIGGSVAYGIYGTRGVAAPANTPGGRSKAVTWVDTNGQLWLFSGYGYDSSNNGAFFSQYLNDLWRYDPTSNQWTWVGGPDISGQSGIYGVLGTADPTNIPGARASENVWYDGTSGLLWLFGGYGFDSSSNGNYDVLNDLWRLQP